MCNNASGKTEFLLRSYPELSGSSFDSSHTAAALKGKKPNFQGAN